MRTYKPHKHRSKEEQAKINAEVAKRKAKPAEKYNTDTQYYKGICVFGREVASPTVPMPP
jgi:hypothetical protein